MVANKFRGRPAIAALSSVIFAACTGSGSSASPSIGSGTDVAKGDSTAATDSANAADGALLPDDATAADAKPSDGPSDATPVATDAITSGGSEDNGQFADGSADAAPGGCQSAADCDDNDYCSADVCKADGSCEHAAIAGCVAPLAPCNSKNLCKSGVCDSATNACVACLATIDCQAGQICQAKQCKPAQTCKSDIECKTLQRVCGKADGLCVDCNSTLDCGPGEQCLGTQCVGAAPCKSSKDCPAVCNQAKGICVDCVSTDNCAPGKFCTSDGHCAQAICLGPSCGSGSWQFGCKADGSAYLPGQTCDDSSPCTDGSCSTSKGCIQLPNAQPCEDGNACTQSDTCANFACTGKPLVCSDGNPCTDDSCDTQGACKFLANTVSCDDASTCTQSDKCRGGPCKGVGVNCDVGKGGCYFTSNTAVCEDGSACSVGDKCSHGKCVSGGALVCDDKSACTTDQCDVTKGCQFLPTTGCDDKDPCTSDSCNPTSGTCSHAAIAQCCAVGNVAFSLDFEFGFAAALAISNSSGLAKKGWRVWDPAKYATSGKAAVYYGDPALQNYNFSENSGTATIGLGNLPPSGKLRLEFQLYFAVEKYLSYDKLDITLSAGGKSDVSVWTKASLGTYACNTTSANYTCVNLPTGWTTVKYDMPSGYSSDAKITLKFSTVDNNYNDTLGVLIDDIKVVQASCN